MRMKTLSSAIVFGIGFVMLPGTPARAQVGDMKALQKGAGDAAKQEVMKGAAEKAGLPATGTPGAPDADGAAATAPAAADAPAAAPGTDSGATNAPVGAPKVAPDVADAPTPAPGAAGGVGKRMMPTVP